MQTAKLSAFKITPSIRQEIVQIVDARIKEAHVTKEDFSELKNIVKDLASAQKRTEIKVEELAEAQKRTEVKVEELAEAQKRTEVKVEELAEAQRRTELRLEELATAQKELAEAQKRTEAGIAALTGVIKEVQGDIKEVQAELGGIGRSVGYALENEAYRNLPSILQERYGITVREKIIRAQIGGQEINVFGRADKDGREVFVVGETKTRLDERREIDMVFAKLEEKVQAVIDEFGQKEIVKLLIAHYARKLALDMASDKGIIVVQSFEW
jgi:hypothetical protein